MATSTGPGRIEVFPVPPAADLEELIALLFNFDVGGSKLKPEHQVWLDRNVKPLVRRPGMEIGVRGLASRSGSDQVNQALSEKRVKSVKDVLLGYGAKVKQLTQSAGGETDAMLAGAVDGTEDERWRAVLLHVDVPLTNITARFDRRDPAKRNDGFDATGKHPWLMIPAEDPFQDVRLLDGEGLRLISTNPSVVRVVMPFDPAGPPVVTNNPEFIQLQATGKGDAEIQAVNASGHVRTRLEVSVFRQLTVNVAFHYVSHAAIGTKTRRIGEEIAMLRIVNNIYRPQANIRFHSIQARNLPVTGSFGTQVNEGTVDWDTIVMLRNAGAQFNVFFVSEVEQGIEPPAGTTDAHDDADALTNIGPPGDCIFEDAAGTDVGESLAHEAGHMLNVRHNTPITSRRHMLMWDTTDQRGRFIPRVHVLRMRRAVR